MMRTQISIIAGNILTLLEDTDHLLSLEEVKTKIDVSHELILMSVGWLVREGYVQLNQIGGKYFIYQPVESAIEMVR
jgi:predicted transcriptional regulator